MVEKRAKTPEQPESSVKEPRLDAKDRDADSPEQEKYMQVTFKG